MIFLTPAGTLTLLIFSFIVAICITEFIKRHEKEERYKNYKTYKEVKRIRKHLISNKLKIGKQ